MDKVFEGKGVTGVVVALGGKTKDVGATMLQDGTANIIAAMKANDVKRISVVTTIGAGDSMDQVRHGGARCTPSVPLRPPSPRRHPSGRAPRPGARRRGPSGC